MVDVAEMANAYSIKFGKGRKAVEVRVLSSTLLVEKYREQCKVLSSYLVFS